MRCISNMNDEPVQRDFEKAAKAISLAPALLITSGAVRVTMVVFATWLRLSLTSTQGLGVDSGLGTFRGRMSKVWPIMDHVLELEYNDLSSAKWFERDARLAWAYWSGWMNSCSFFSKYQQPYMKSHRILSSIAKQGLDSCGLSWIPSAWRVSYFKRMVSGESKGILFIHK